MHILNSEELNENRATVITYRCKLRLALVVFCVKTR